MIASRGAAFAEERMRTSKRASVEGRRGGASRMPVAGPVAEGMHPRFSEDVEEGQQRHVKMNQVAPEPPPCAPGAKLEPLILPPENGAGGLHRSDSVQSARSSNASNLRVEDEENIAAIRQGGGTQMSVIASLPVAYRLKNSVSLSLTLISPLLLVPGCATRSSC